MNGLEVSISKKSQGKLCSGDAVYAAYCTGVSLAVLVINQPEKPKLLNFSLHLLSPFVGIFRTWNQIWVVNEAPTTLLSPEASSTAISYNVCQLLMEFKKSDPISLAGSLTKVVCVSKE